MGKSTLIEAITVANGFNAEGGVSSIAKGGGRSTNNRMVWALFMNRFSGTGLYILDEPEAALSPTRQMAMLVRMHDLIVEGAQ